MRNVLMFLSALIVAKAPSIAAVSFNRDIRPIMSDTCFRCHGPDKSSRMAGMRLDIREEALKPTKSGVTPIMPGKPEASAIVERVFAANAAKRMPPKYSHKELTDQQKQTIKQWVAEGAKYEGHWAYQPVHRPAIPAVGATNPIDAFILERLALEGLKPSPEADRRTLIRRVTLDLTGLPPTRQEVKQFLADQSADAYEKVVDRLLASPRYAEKQAMHWLDAVRYADTCGFHGDNPFPAWPYRDYVLRAFRDNKPFDEFTREQIAGDLLENPARDQLVASAYNRMNRTSAEGGLQPKEYLAKYGADRVRTTSIVWLGSTMGCAECHDHKFDPFTAKDFYSMKAFFADIKETGLVPDKGPKAWGTLLALPTEAQTARLESLKSRIDAVQERMAPIGHARDERRTAWEKQILARYEAESLTWLGQKPVSAASRNGAKLEVYNDRFVESNFDAGSSIASAKVRGDGLIVASGPNPDNETYTVTLKPGAGAWTALGLEVVQDETLPGLGFARGADRFVVSEVEMEIGGKSVPFGFASSNTVASAAELPAMAAIDANAETGWGLITYGDARVPFLALRFAEKMTTDAASVITVRLRHDSSTRRATLGRFRLSLSTAEKPWHEANRTGKDEKLGGLPDDVAKALVIAEDKRSADQRKAVDRFYVWSTSGDVVELAKLEAERGMLDVAIPRVVVSEATTPEETRILPRGNFLDESGEVVQPAIPAFLGKLDVRQRATRLDLSNWLVSKDNPLTARVFANRMWRLLFGTGLSKALDDIGSQGEWPTHPELLDWLASEFMDPTYKVNGAHDWNVNHLLRTIVVSQTYRQSSNNNPQPEERDPFNRLLARQSRYRVDAESVRDMALTVSGLMKEKFGGPSVKPYEPDGYLVALNFPKREYAASHGDDLYRRGLYTHWQRTFLHPEMMTFDAPSREECMVNRVTSNTPLQALALLNDPVFVEAARVFAQNILRTGAGGVQAQIQWAFERALNRPATAQETSILMDLHHKNLVRFQAAPASAKELIQVGEAPFVKKQKPVDLAAMMTVARAILNLHEAITRN